MNLDAVRRVLRADPVWGIYALGDLAPSRLPHAQWFVSPAETALALLYGEFGDPILFLAGEVADVELLLQTVPLPDHVYLHMWPQMLPLMQRRFTHRHTKPMLRMTTEAMAPVDTHDVVRLSGADLEEVAALYADGEASGESPDFFYRQMLDDETFRGIRQDGRLVAAAGTHMVFDDESIAAVGNVYTHRQWRNRGFGRRVTAAVVQSLFARGFRTIALNVSAANTAAQRVYEALGFRVHCDFVEGEARSESSSARFLSTPQR